MESQVVIDNLVSPTSLVSFDQHLYITDQPGYIYQLAPNGDIVRWLDISNVIFPLQESGLLDIAFMDNGSHIIMFSSRIVETINQYVPIFLAKNINVDSQDLHVDIISIIPIGEDGNPIIEGEKILFGILRDLPIHHGGRLLIDGDYLYITTGDSGPQMDTNYRAQDLTSILGKVLRIIPNIDGSYIIPDDNPFGEEALPEIYAYGFRNPWSMSQDNSGRIFIADVGAEDWEEVDILERGGNYGWNIKEGSYFTDWSGEERNIPLIDPIYEYPHRVDGPSAIMGGYYIDEDHPLYLSGYYFADIVGPMMRIIQDDEEWYLDNEWNLPAGLTIHGWGSDGNFLYFYGSNNNLPEGQQGYVRRLLAFT